MDQKFKHKEILIRVAGCLGLGLEEREGYEGFILYDLRDPDDVVLCSSEPGEPCELSQVAGYLHRVLKEMDPVEIGNERFDRVLHPYDQGRWAYLYGLSVILSTVSYYASDELENRIADLVYTRFVEILTEIVEDTQAELLE